METYTLKRKIGSDGMLRVELPIGISDVEVDVVIVVNQVQKASSNQTSLEKIKAKHPRAYEPWTEEEEQQLLDLMQAGYTEGEIAKKLERRTGAVFSRIRKIEKRDSID